MHVVRDAERRGGGVGPGVLGFDPALLRSIAERVGTPVYVYGANLIRAQYHALHDALQDVPHRICYSVKANGNVGVLKVLKALGAGADIDRKSTRLNSSHGYISYAVFCLKKKKKKENRIQLNTDLQEQRIALRR